MSPKATTSYWPGLFHCYDLADLPRTNNELEHFLAQHATMNDGRAGENKRPQGWSSCGAVRVVASVASRLASFFWDQSFVRPISPNGVPCGANWNYRHEARRIQRRFRTSPESYLAILEEKLSKGKITAVVFLLRIIGIVTCSNQCCLLRCVF